MNKYFIGFLVLFACLHLVLSEPVQAQFRVGASGTFSVPTGDFGTINKNGYGGSIGAKFAISPRFSLSANLSFLSFGRPGDQLSDLSQGFGLSESTIELLEALSIDSLLEVPQVRFYPINLGFEYNITLTKLRPYIGAGFGMYITDTESLELNLSELVLRFFELQDQTPPPVSLGSIDLQASDTNFGMSITAGLAYDFHEHWSADFNFTTNGIYVPEEKSGAAVLSFSLGVFYKIQSKQ